MVSGSAVNTSGTALLVLYAEEGTDGVVSSSSVAISITGKVLSDPVVDASGAVLLELYAEEGTDVVVLSSSVAITVTG